MPSPSSAPATSNQDPSNSNHDEQSSCLSEASSSSPSSPSPTSSAASGVMSKSRISHRPSPKPLRIFITGYMIVCWFASFILSVLVQLILWLLLFPLFLYNPRLKTIILGSVFHWFSCASGFIVNPFWRFVLVKPAPKGYTPSDTLIMVNHTSGADPWITARAILPWEVKFIFKGDLLKIPIAGWTLSMSGDIPIHFTKEKGGWGTAQGAVSRMMDEVKALQNMGLAEVVFPEGTRSKHGRLQPFKDGFFRFAVENNCEILPCVIHNAQKIWPMGSSLVDMGTVYFAFGEPTRPKEGETVEELKTRIRHEMIELQKLCPLFDPVAEKALGEHEFTSSRGQGLVGR